VETRTHSKKTGLPRTGFFSGIQGLTKSQTLSKPAPNRFNPSGAKTEKPYE